MDISSILLNSMQQAWYFLPIFILFFIFKTSWFKGVLGEFIVNLIIKRLPKDDYHLIKNVTLPTDDGTTQIDHIVVSKFGIFVLETKNFKGWIFGSANQKQWTQKIFKNAFKFQNPLHQNYKHLKTLESLLCVNSETLFSVIVFIGDSKFKTDMPENVTYASGCLSYIRSKKIELFSSREVSNIIKNIESGRLDRGFVTNQTHKSHVQEIIGKKENTQHCPKCNSTMVLRESKKGSKVGSKFWGCSTFPKCRSVVTFIHTSHLSRTNNS
ncbi:MAG: NERD domain-containing protein [Colwellia sp.]